MVGAGAGMLVMWGTSRLMQWLAAHPEKDLLVMFIGIGLGAAIAVYAAVKPYPADYDATGKLIVDGAKMANDTFKGVGYCAAFLVGCVLERRFVGFSTEVSLPKKLSRAVIGLMGYYAVSLILGALLKQWLPGAAGSALTCFLQIFCIVFLFPACFKRFEQKGTAA